MMSRERGKITSPFVSERPGRNTGGVSTPGLSVTDQLISRTTVLPSGQDWSLLSLLPSPDSAAWVRHGSGLVGLGPMLRIDLPSATAFADAAATWQRLCAGAAVRDDVRLPGTGPVAFVSYPFSPGSAAGGVLLVPSVVIGRRAATTWVTSMSWTSGLPPLPQVGPGHPPPGPGRVDLGPGTLTPATWRQRVSAAVEQIAAGRLDKVVLARDVVASTAEPVDARWLAERLTTDYPSCWTFAVDGLVGATPELLVRCERGLVTSRVLAGTIRRTGDDEHDLALAASLARSSKDLEEHEYAVRSVADALTPHCDSMYVPESPFVLHLPNVMHLATDVTGALHRPAGAGPAPSVLELVSSLHPSAAVCGTPTATAAAVIEELEEMERGRYAGPVGWVDAAGDGEFGIALRCGRIDPGNPRSMRLFAGCGIVAGSDPTSELAESEAKMEPMKQALVGRFKA